MNIFISYSKRRNEVKSLADDLEGMGHSVWFDREITGAYLWWDKILQEILRCDLFVYALTPEVLDSKACEAELHYAQALEKRILPIMLIKVNIDLLSSKLGLTQIA